VAAAITQVHGLDDRPYRLCNDRVYRHCVRSVGGAGKPEINPGPGPAANSTSCAYAEGLLYFRTESSTDARLVCYDLRAN